MVHSLPILLHARRQFDIGENGRNQAYGGASTANGLAVLYICEGTSWPQESIVP